MEKNPDPYPWTIKEGIYLYMIFDLHGELSGGREDEGSEDATLLVHSLPLNIAQHFIVIFSVHRILEGNIPSFLRLSLLVI